MNHPLSNQFIQWKKLRINSPYVRNPPGVTCYFSLTSFPPFFLLIRFFSTIILHILIHGNKGSD